ncbi:MAG: hypothetical protein ABIW19_00490 [Vicinamibacterales bacterium]
MDDPQTVEMIDRAENLPEISAGAIELKRPRLLVDQPRHRAPLNIFHHQKELIMLAKAFDQPDDILMPQPLLHLRLATKPCLEFVIHILDLDHLDGYQFLAPLKSPTVDAAHPPRADLIEKLIPPHVPAPRRWPVLRIIIRHRFQNMI